MSDLTEIRWHGRAGQGIVTAGELLAESAMEEGKYFQAFPDYGPERMGAPIRAFTRISDRPIDIHCQITAPDIVVIVDPSVINVVDVTEGLKPGGRVLVNTTDSPAKVRQQLHLTSGEVFTVDATGISVATLGRAMPNTPMLGALVKATGLVSLEGIKDYTKERLGAKFRAQVVDANLESIQRAYDEVVEG
jgi:pyruvate ferredoxin oxidoreductase gamma subunit